MDSPYVFQGVHMLFSGTFMKKVGMKQKIGKHTSFLLVKILIEIILLMVSKIVLQKS
jgi:hypothetical protein